jgi:hypothetical protein
MSLKLGTRLGTYEILSAIGAGGMGEVYCARDTKLGRDVAIKVLPESVATDPERLARFHREAQVLASQYFQRSLMRQYLNIKGEAVNSLEDKFEKARFFCLVGTNARDYDEVYGLSRWAAGPVSDGLVAVQNAYVDGTPRAYVHRRRTSARFAAYGRCGELRAGCPR